MAKGVRDASGAANKAKAAFSGLWGVISAHPFVSITAGAIALITILNKLSSIHDKVVKEASDNLFGANEDYNSTVSEIESINSELETTQARMNELQAKGYLSLTEKEELFNLQQQNDELERTLSLKEMEAKIDARAAAQKADEAYDVYTHGEDLFGNQKENADQAYSRESIDAFKDDFSAYPRESHIEYIKYNATASWLRKRTFAGTQLEDLDFESHRDNINYLIAGYESIQSEKKAAEEAISDIAEQSKTASVKEMADLTKQSNALQKYYEELSSNETSALLYMNEYALVMQEAYSAYTKAEAEGVILPDQKKRLEEAESFLTEYGKIMTNTAMDTENAINNIFAKSEFAGLQEKLLSSGESGGPDAVAKLIAETPELTDALADAGIEAEQLTDHIMAIADPSKLRLDVVKEQLRDAFVSDEKDFDSAKVWDDLVKDKTDKEIEIFYRYKLEKNLDMSDWDTEDLQYNMQQALDWAAEENPLDFSSILSTEEISKQIDDFQSNTSTIQSALASIKEGENIDLTDLVQQFPELAGQTDNLQEALSNLQLDKIHEFGESWKSALEGMDEADIPKANEFFSNLMDGIDLSGMNLSDLKKDITGALLPDPGDNYATDFLSEFEAELSNRDDMELLWKIAMDPSNANKTVDELRATFDNMKLEAKAYVKWDEDHPLFDEHTAAEQTENAGDRYLAMMEDFKKAQEDFENNLTGTDDFKTTAAMASPNGFTDPANWAENYGKVMRYFTEDKTGVLNFLTDLETKVGENGRKLAEYNENTGQWKLNLADMGDAADQLGISFEAFTAILGRLGDYGFTNDFFASFEEGIEKSADLRTQLAEAKAKYKDLQAEGASDSVLASQYAEIESLEARIRDVDSMLDQVKARSAEEYAEEARSKSRHLYELGDQLEAADNPLTRNLMLDDIESLAQELNIEVKYKYNENGEIVGFAAETKSQLEQAINEEPVEIEPPDTSKMQEKISSAMKDETSGIKEQLATLSEYTKDELGEITFGDGMAEESEGLARAEAAVDSIISALGLGQEDAQLLIAALQEMGYLKPELENPEELAEETKSAVESASPVKVEGEAEVETSDIEQKIQDLENQKATLNVDTEEGKAAVEEINSEIGALKNEQISIAIQTQVDSGTSVDQLLAMDDETLATTLQIDTSQVDIARQQLSELQETTTEASVTVKIDESQFEQLSLSGDKELNYQININGKDSLDDAISKIKDIPEGTKSVSISIDTNGFNPDELETIRRSLFELNANNPNSTITISGVNFALGQIDEVSGRLDGVDSNNPDPTITAIDHASGTINAVSSLLSSIDGRTATTTITTVHQTVTQTIDGGSGDAAGTATGTMLATAHANGTAYNVHNLIPLSRANAMGSDVAIKKDQKSLLNEIGQESLIFIEST